MKKVVLALCSSMFLLAACAASDAPIVVVHPVPASVPIVPKMVSKRSCISIVDQRTKKLIQQCKNIKIHKKYQGTPVPPNKKK